MKEVVVKVKAGVRGDRHAKTATRVLSEELINRAVIACHSSHADMAPNNNAQSTIPMENCYISYARRRP